MKLPLPKFSKPKTALTSGILVAIIFGLALFVYFNGSKQENKTLRPGEQYGVQYRDPSEIVITNLGNGTKRAEDKRQGYSVVVPSDWQIEKPETVNRNLSFYSGSCKFGTGFMNSELKLEDVIKNNEEDQNYMTVKQYTKEDFAKNNYTGAHTILFTEETGFVERYYIQVDNKIFSVSLGVLDKNKEICSQELLQLANSLEL